MDIKMNETNFSDLLGRLSIPYTIENINDSIKHIKMWHNGKMFRMRFVYNDGCYIFTNFLEG